MGAVRGHDRREAAAGCVERTIPRLGAVALLVGALGVANGEIVVLGGPQLARMLIEHDLVDKLRLTI
jgi:dihydrofolate reductase